MNINELVLESYKSNTLIEERSWQIKRRVVPISSQKKFAIRGQIRSLSKNSALSKQIKVKNQQLKALRDRQRSMYANKAKMLAMTKKR